MGDEKLMLNQKGIFLTFLAFLLIGSVLAINVVTQQSNVSRTRGVIDESAFGEINQQFNSIYSQILTPREGYAGVVQQRIIPQAGSYSYGGNTLEITQEVPPTEYGTIQSDTFDALNLFSVFIANQRINQGLDVNSKITTAFNLGAWGGTGGDNPEYGYLIQPYCLRYLPTQFGDRFMGYQIPGETWDEWTFEKANGTCDATVASGPKSCNPHECCYDWGCELPFDTAHIKAIDIDFTVGNTTAECADYLTGPEKCEGQNMFGSGSACTAACSTPGNNQCVTVNFYEEKCIGQPCTPIVHGHKVAANLDLTKTKNEIKLPLTAGGSAGDLTLHILSKNDNDNPIGSGKIFLLYYDGSVTCLVNTVKLSITFDGPVGTVQYAGFDFSVKKPGFDYCRRTAGASCN
ncbi:MAG: hypothetical protein NTW59_02450 [Candidatus Diapherotrites archaeon]|nr:hypothetical protein [Candidatus Diapherotrites archaeon]